MIEKRTAAFDMFESIRRCLNRASAALNFLKKFKEKRE